MLIRRLKAIVGLMPTVLAMASSAHCGTVYVWCGSTGDPDGLAWNTAFHTVQQGIDAASSGDQVWVAGGCVYSERVTLKDGVALYGGFPSGGGSWASRNPAAHETVIDGGQGGSVVTVPANASSGTVIDGFTIRNGKATYGGGITCGSGASPTITNNLISQNTATSYGGGIFGGGVISGNRIGGNSAGSSGGGIFCGTTSAVISGNFISDNRAAWGGGIRFHSSTGEITGNIITRNTATSGAGGVNLNSASPLVASNVFAGNHSAGTAGGLDVNNSSSIVANNTLSDNTASQGGGIALRGTGSPWLCNNIVAFNSSGIYRYGYTSLPVLRNNDVYQNTSYDYMGIEKGATDVSVDPGFVDRTAGNYHIVVASGCRDKGFDSVVSDEWEDMDGEPRVFPPHVDIGADEVHQYAALADAKKEADGYWITAVDVIVTAVWPDHFYVEMPDRSCGMRVELPGHSVSVGQKVVVGGRMQVTPGMERYIAAAGVSSVGTTQLQPVALANKALGGSDWGPDPTVGHGQAGVAGSVGLNNIGLLVRTSGRVTGRGRDWFYIDDGSGVSDGTPYSGVYVEAAGLRVPARDAWAVVTGISSCEVFGGKVVNVLIPRSDADVNVIGITQPMASEQFTAGEPHPCLGTMWCEQYAPTQAAHRGLLSTETGLDANPRR